MKTSTLASYLRIHISIFYVQYKAYNLKVLILTVKLSEIVFEFNIIKMTCLVNLTLFSRKKIHAKLYDFFFSDQSASMFQCWKK